ncbi:MAG: UV-damage endonuclease [Pycnora praestabilis]|nr:MAG: UV-damage endonuclease [Pycnora praestabilis]
MARRKRSSAASAVIQPAHETPIPLPPDPILRSEQRRRSSQRKPSQSQPLPIKTDPNQNVEILDGAEALRASPEGQGEGIRLTLAGPKSGVGAEVKKESSPLPNGVAYESGSSLSELSDIESPEKPSTTAKAKVPSKTKPKNEPATPAAKKAAAKVKKDDLQTERYIDPEEEDEEAPEEEEVKAALSRPPPINSDYLPLPWKGRLGYACLCTYLRFSNPPVFSSRTCRIASILENRHPLKDPSQPQHATKNRPDREQPADEARGQAYVESIGVANAKDIPKMLRWNDKYGIKFLRLSSEMFPFASHDKYGYKLAPFASEALAEAGKVAAELGHRLTTHPGQFTQLGSPRTEVITASYRDLDYHAELLSLLKLPPQQDRDAVMILHMGGAFGDKAATLDRFRENYKTLSQGVKDRLVLENDDVIWSVHDLLPVCQELNIPLVLDYHHHNIIFNPEKLREGTLDIMDLYDEIRETWTRKDITQKMHYSEPTPAAITGRQRRKHNPRVATLPPCTPDMDLMIEAKDKEQAVFELMRTFKLPGFDTFNDIIPHVRNDDNKPVKPLPKKRATPKKKGKKGAKKEEEEEEDLLEEIEEELAEKEHVPIPEEEVGMGGPEGRVYWPPGMEEWLRPIKRVVKKKEPKEEGAVKKEVMTAGKKRKIFEDAAEAAEAVANGVALEASAFVEKPVETLAKKTKATPRKAVSKPKRNVKAVPTPSASDDEASEAMPDLSEVETATPIRPRPASARQSGRAKKLNYAEDG